MISLFLSLCESLGISIMFVFLLLNGGEWCEHGKQCSYKRDTKFEAKYTSCFWMDWCVVEIAFKMLETLLIYDERMNAHDE